MHTPPSKHRQTNMESTPLLQARRMRSTAQVPVAPGRAFGIRDGGGQEVAYLQSEDQVYKHIRTIQRKSVPARFRAVGRNPVCTG